jgi:hypothetical protein
MVYDHLTNVLRVGGLIEVGINASCAVNQQLVHSTKNFHPKMFVKKFVNIVTQIFNFDDEVFLLSIHRD